MTADEYRNALATWKIKHKAAAKFFGITVITSQRYATGEREVPPAMAKLIRFMAALELTPEYVDRQIERWGESDVR